MNDCVRCRIISATFRAQGPWPGGIGEAILHILLLEPLACWQESAPSRQRSNVQGAETRGINLLQARWINNPCS